MPDSGGSESLSASDALVLMLKDYGVKHVFGLCGDTSLPLYDSLARLDHGIVHLVTRDERHCAYMADAYARATGRPGVCEGPSGGGATYILPGIVEANESSVPVLAITTDVATTSRGRYPLTELDQVSLFSTLSKWNASIDSPNALPSMLRKAFRAMTTGRPGAVHLSLPFDTQQGSVERSEIWTEPTHTRFPAERAAPEHAKIEQAASLLGKARSAIAICGGGVVTSEAFEALWRLADVCDLPVATSVSGQGSIAETDPQAVGVVGSNGGVPSTRAVVDEADVVLFIGVRAGSVTTERWRSPSDKAKVIHIDCDPDVIGANYKTEVGICADARLALEALAEELAGRKDRNQQDGRARAKKAWEKKVADFDLLANSDQEPVRPEAVIACLMDLLGDDALIAADPGTPCPYVSAHYRWRKPGRHMFTNRAHGALGYALPAAIGAHVGRPDAKAVALLGDGSFNFCCGELETIVRLNMPITTVVFSNATYGWIKAGQKSGFDERYYNVDFGRTDHAAVAQAFGVKSWKVEDPSRLKAVMREALESDGPTLVDVISQPLQEAAAPVSEWVA